jgi:hypothetical protein
MPTFRTTKEMAAKLRLSPWTVYQLAKRQQIPCHRRTSQSRLLFIEEEVMQALFPEVSRDLLQKPHAA